MSLIKEYFTQEETEAKNYVCKRMPFRLSALYKVQTQ